MKFTIIVPAYNSAEFINIPLESLEKQTFQDFEVLIVNDGSTDNTSEIVYKFIANNPNWRLIEKKNGNWGSVMNHVKRNEDIKGEYITILDSDDYFLPTCLKQVNQVANEDMVITDLIVKKQHKSKVAHVYFAKEGILKPAKKRTPLSMPHGKFYKKELFLKMVDLEEGISYQDTVLYHDLATKANKIFYLRKPLAIWWQSRTGNSTNVTWDQKRIDILYKTFDNNIVLENMDNEIYAWILMYLWDVKRNIKHSGKLIMPDLSIPIKSVKFTWLPFGTRTMAKKFFVKVTKKMWKK